MSKPVDVYREAAKFLGWQDAMICLPVPRALEMLWEQAMKAGSEQERLVWVKRSKDWRLVDSSGKEITGLERMKLLGIGLTDMLEAEQTCPSR